MAKELGKSKGCTSTGTKPGEQYSTRETNVQTHESTPLYCKSAKPARLGQ